MPKFFMRRRLHWAQQCALRQVSAFAACLTALLLLPIKLSGEDCSSAAGAIGESTWSPHWKGATGIHWKGSAGQGSPWIQIFKRPFLFLLELTGVKIIKTLLRVLMCCIPNGKGYTFFSLATLFLSSLFHSRPFQSIKVTGKVSPQY